jgi:hypothetical protein
LIEPTTERGRRLAALSQRLRMLHTELAEQSPEMRVEQLRDEVQRAVSSMPPQEREGFLSELAQQFPLWSASNGTMPKAAPAAATAAPLPTDPKSLAEMLIELGRGMSQAEKDAVTARLSAGGFSTVVKEVVRESGGGGGAAFPPAALAEFKKAVGLPADGEVNPGRLLELAALLTEFTLKIEPWACSYWRDLAPDAKNPIYQTLNKEFPRYVSGDDKITKEAMHKSVYKLRSLVSLLMKGVMEAGKQFARDHMTRYSMEAVRESAPKETFKSDEYRCWKQYERLMEGVDAPAIEKRIKQLIAKDVDTGLSQVIR